MKQTRLIMGMPITVNADSHINEVFSYFKQVDEKFSPYKNKIIPQDPEIVRLCEQTKKETAGYFDAWYTGRFDPTGLVKGWAVYNASKLLRREFFIDAGGDIQAGGKIWRVGIRNPFNLTQIVKVLKIKDRGVATSGNYERGKHIFNPKTGQPADEITSLTVIGPNIYEADRFATAAFAMGKKGIYFIEKQTGLEGYMIDKTGVATATSGLDKYAG